MVRIYIKPSLITSIEFDVASGVGPGIIYRLQSNSWTRALILQIVPAN